MKPENNFIDELFEKNLGSQGLGTASQGWAALSSSLAKKGFIAYFRTHLWTKLAAVLFLLSAVTIAIALIIYPNIYSNKSITHSKSITYQNSTSDINQISQSTENNLHVLTQTDSNIKKERDKKSNITTTENFDVDNKLSNRRTIINTSVKQKANSENIFQNTNREISKIRSGNGEIKESISEKEKIISLTNNNETFEILSEPKHEIQTNSNKQNSNYTNLKIKDNLIHKVKEENKKEPNNPSEITENKDNSTSIIFKKDQVTIETSDLSEVETEKIQEEIIIQPKNISTQISKKNDIGNSINKESENFSDNRINITNRTEYAQLLKINTLPLKGLKSLFDNNTNLLLIKENTFSLPINSSFNSLSWAVSAYYALHKPAISLSTNNAESKPHLSYIETGLQKPQAYGTGFRIEARGRNYLIESGLSYFDFSQQAKYNTSDFIFNDVSTWNYWDTTYQTIDTIDSYYQVVGIDTIWIYETETNTITLSDSLLTTVIDTLKDEQTYLFSNNFKYIEIPLIFGYSFNSNRFTTSIKAGLITSLLWRANFQSLTSPSANDVYAFNHNDFPTVQFHLYTGLEVRYYIGARYFVFGESFYRQSFKPFAVRNDINYRFNSYGIKLGAGMYF